MKSRILHLDTPNYVFFSRLQLAHMESLEEVITILLHQALSTEPHKATLLRTKADFAYG